MLITCKEKLENYTVKKHLWLGIPSIEVTKKGRVFITFYSGGTKEQIGNYVILIKADDGVHFSEPVAAAYEEGHRCFDPCLWMDPLGRLWFTWARYPDDGVFGVVCDDPDAEELVWSEERLLGHNIMMNKPTVFSTGEWAFPIAAWTDGVCAGSLENNVPNAPGAYTYVSTDEGKTLGMRGGAQVANRSFDEHMILEMKDGTLRTYVRTNYGIGYAVSRDGGKTWVESEEGRIEGPSARFFIRRLPSGRILLVHHADTKERNNLTAMLSDDEGKTFPHRLLLDPRSWVSYPDCAVRGGTLHICYDRERGAFCKNAQAALSQAREILYSRITEEDILAGGIVGGESFLGRVAYKLREYDGDADALFEEN